MAIKAIAKKRVYNGNERGYTLEEVSTGKLFDVSDDNIKKFINGGQIEVTNLYINDAGVLNEKEDSIDEGKGISKEESINKRQENIDDIEEMRSMIEKLNEATKVYEQGKDEIMSNHEWDAMYDKLVELENKTGIKLQNTPTEKVGYEVVGELPKERHDTRMLSLGKTKDVNELKAFLGDKKGVLSYKLDGLTVVLTYNNGELHKAVTRGNGDIGEVVTNNAKQFKNIPMRIPFKGKLVLRGEAVMSYETFAKVNAKSGGEYKNPRNLCSGSVRQLDSRITAEREIKWYCFSLVEAEGLEINEVGERLHFVKKMGFETVHWVYVNRASINGKLDDATESVNTGKLGIPVDGMVLTYNDSKYGESLGETSKTPRHSIAFKWSDDIHYTKMVGIEWSPSRTGLINPVALFEPVEIDGTTVSRASVHNISIFKDLMLGYGDRVGVYKANMIIPQIYDNLDSTMTIEIPQSCPCCNHRTEIRVEQSSGVETLWCTNDMCQAKTINSFKQFVSRDAMNIEGVSIATIEKLMDVGLITDFASIYDLGDHIREIASLEGFGIVSAQNIIRAIDKSRVVQLPNLIYALGIPNVGLSTAKLVCEHFNEDASALVNAGYLELSSIEGVGDVISESIEDYFNDEDKLEKFIELYNRLIVTKREKSDEQTMKGVTICVTGSVNIFKNRNQIKDIVENLGGKLSGSVSKVTSYLVTNDTTSGSSKNKAAKQYGISILTEEEFIEKFELMKYI